MGWRWPIFAWVYWAAFLLILLAISPALAHDPDTGDPNWITEGAYSGADNIHCCGPRDCFPIKPDRIKQTPAGFVLLDYENELVPYSEATPSEDKRFWRCQKWDKTRRCFFAPYGGT